MAKLKKRILSVICALVLLIILVAGLWPFRAPENKVSWLTDANGLSFGDHGSILSSGLFDPANYKDGKSCSIELWLRPERIHGSRTILAFYLPAEVVIPFSLHQWNSNLVLRRETSRPQPAESQIEIGVGEVFHLDKDVFLTITGGRQGTAVYVDGVLVNRFAQFDLSIDDFVGQLVINNSPLALNGGAGQLRGIGIYNQDLSPAQVEQHHDSWISNGQPKVSESEHPVALYLFDEGAGRVVHSQLRPGIDLYIPDRYFIVNAPFLECPWHEFRGGVNYWKDVLVNIAGFVPLGFFFCAYFSVLQVFGRPARLTVAVGATISLTIEVLQAFLPTRGSGTTDLITNTLGTALGVLLFNFALAHSAMWQHLFSDVSKGAKANVR
jgi:hypothetical protein